MTEPETPVPADDTVEETDQVSGDDATTTTTRAPRHAMPDDFDSADESSDAGADDDDTDSDEDVDDSEDVPEADSEGDAEADEATARDASWPRVVAFAVLPAVALILALGAGYLKWQDITVQRNAAASAEALAEAKATTTAILSYQPDTVEQQLTAARDRLTGGFLQSYTKLTSEVVIPGAQQQRIAATANVPAAGAVSADTNHAEVLLMVNQSVSVGQNAPTSTASAVQVKLEKIDNRWLVSEFTPV